MNNKTLIIIIVIFSLLLIGIFLIVFVFGNPQGESPPIILAICSCTEDLNCDDFTTQAEAQVCFEYCGGVDNDVHGLDGNNDGVVCEGLG